LLGQIVRDWQTHEPSDQRLASLEVLIGHKAEAILQQCDTHLGYAGNHDLPFLLPLFRSPRKACLDVLELLRPTSTSADTTLEQAMTFILRHRHTRAAQLPIRGDGQGAEARLDVSRANLATNSLTLVRSELDCTQYTSARRATMRRSGMIKRSTHERPRVDI
jgi:hypothetical protein